MTLPNADVRGEAGGLDPFKVQANFEALNQSTPDKIPLVTSLPPSALDGTVIYYLASSANSILWELRYRAAARSNAGAWEFLGGSRLTATGANTAINTGSYTVYANVAPTITAPLKGTYVASASGNVFGTAGGGGIDCGIRLSPDSGTVTGSDNASTAGYVREFIGMADRTFTTTAAATTVRLQGFSIGAVTFSSFSVSIQPIFVYV